MKKHTPGPWRVAFDTEITTSTPGIVEGSKRVADCANILKPTDEVTANAQLISAAPDLLHACDEAETAFAVVQLCDELTPQAQSTVREARRICQDAIAKARPDSAFAEAVAVVRQADADEITRLRGALSSLLYVINQDKDGSYFICEEAAQVVTDAKDALEGRG